MIDDGREALVVSVYGVRFVVLWAVKREQAVGLGEI